MIIGIIIVLIFVILGTLLGLNVTIPYSYSQYVAVAILACLDSVFGAFVANKEKKFKMDIFLSGFFGNSLIAMFLVYIGSKLNVDIYLAAVIVFSGRLLNNFSAIRRIFVDDLEKRKSKHNKNNENNENYDIIKKDNVKEDVEIEVPIKTAKKQKSLKS